MDWENNLYTFLQDASRYPFGVVRLGWDKQEGPWIHYDNEGRIVSENTIIKSVPSMDAWAPEDFYWPLTFDNTQTMPWLSFRSWLTADRVARMQAQNKLFRMEDSIKALGRRTRTRSIPTPSGLEVREKRERAAGLNVVDTAMLELHEMWMEFPMDPTGELSTQGASQKMKVVFDPMQLPTIESMKVLMLHPFMHYRWPAVTGSYERRPHTLPGLGIPQQIGDLNDILDTIHNQNLDQAHVATADIIAHPNADQYTDQLARVWPGKRIGVPDSDAIKAIPMGTLKASSVALEAVIRNYMERRTFLSDFAMGRSPSPSARTSATGTIAQIQEGNKHFDASMKDIRRGLEEVGYQVMELCAQLQPASDIAAALGEQVAREVDQVIRGAGPIRRNVAIEISATTALLNKDTERQNSMLLFNIWTNYANQLFALAEKMSTPGMPPNMKRLSTILSEKAGNLMGDISKTFDRHPDELVPDQEEINAILLATPQPAGPTGVAGVPTNGGGGPAATGGEAALTGLLSAVRPEPTG
jgi:hypothetical protein